MSGLRQIVSARSGSIAGFGALVKVALDAWAWVAQCNARAAERRVLAQLSDWQLHDVGISRAEVDAEAGKWFWRP
jgi:uncharacterized protein YjiS (DUF1127 family)